jgi:predicted dithiol-disulfide oxidoreductase (DUF899 family)
MELPLGFLPPQRLQLRLRGVIHRRKHRPDTTHNYRKLAGPQLDPRNLPVEGHGLSAFALHQGTMYHTYSAYARGTDMLWGMWQWLDRAPLGRNEGDMSWFRRHDAYGTGDRP